MFDFAKWRHWTKDTCEELRKAGFAIEFKTVDGCVSGLSVNATGSSAIGQFSSWDYGLADIDILDTRSKKFVVNRWMIPVDDASFEATYRGFVKDLCYNERK